jgi:hypothetical protein
MASRSVEILAHIELVFFLIVMVIFGAAFAFFMHRQVQPVKARSIVLVAGRITSNSISFLRTIRWNVCHFLYILFTSIQGISHVV